MKPPFCLTAPKTVDKQKAFLRINDVIDVVAEILETKQQNVIFNKSLASISPEDREIIILSRFQQLNYQEISNLLDCNLNTLKSRMRNAISKLQMSYQQLVGENS